MSTSPAKQAEALLHRIPKEEIKRLPPAFQRRLADTCQRVVNLIDGDLTFEEIAERVQATVPVEDGLPRVAGVLADLRRGHRSE